MSVSFFLPMTVLIGLLATRRQAIYWQLVFCLFGAAYAMQMPGAGTITPSILFMPFLVARAYAENYGTRYSRRLPLAAFWLSCAVLYGVICASIIPRMFQGAFEIVALDFNSQTPLSPLRPTTGNLTQSAYAVGSVVVFIALHALLTHPGRLLIFRDGVLLLASLNCVAATLNLAQFHLGLPDVLQYVRNAYRLFGDYAVAGSSLVRLHGTFSETSAFSGFSLPLFAFCFSLWLHKVRPFYTGTLAALLLLFLAISTSSTAYVGIALYGFVLAFVLTYRGYVRGAVPQLGVLIAGVLLTLVLVGSFFVLDTAIGRSLADYFQLTIVDKADSDSGATRAMWTRYAWESFLNTYGLGVGLGTVRGSSVVVVWLANLGLPGTLCYLAFLRLALTGPRDSEPHNSHVIEASRQAILATLSAGLVACTVFDLGIIFYAYAAAASSGGFVTHAYRFGASPNYARGGVLS